MCFAREGEVVSAWWGVVMRTVYEQRTEDAREIERRLRHGTDEIVSPPLFGAVARLCWPRKTAASLAAIAGTDERSAWRWLSGEHEPPGVIIAAIIVKITARK